LEVARAQQHGRPLNGTGTAFLPRRLRRIAPAREARRVKIVAFDENWSKDHPLGTIAFHHMLAGDPASPDNFMLILGRQDADFFMPRHRHNFDQIRLPIRGTMNHGNGLIVGQGEIAYVPEGVAYGPQDDPVAPYEPGERLQLVLQFGGASGCGFMSIEQRRRAVLELSACGRFDGNIYHRNDGTSAWGLNAVWEHVYGTPMTYPRPRYKGVIIADPTCFNWLPVTQGVERKFFGAFSERAVSIETIRIAPGATWSSTDARAKRLAVVLSGTGHAAGSALGELTAIEVAAGEPLELCAESAMELFFIGLPPIERPAVGDVPTEETALGTRAGA
jgi:hypothetical protein